MYDRILYAHDFSEHARPVLRAALDLGRHMRAAVHVLHVITPPLSIPPGTWFAVPAPDIVTFEEKIRASAKEELERAIQGVREAGDPPTILHVQLGEPAGAILAQAEKLDCGLIVMGTHGRKGWQHLMLGSVAERVVRTAPVPVLTIAPAAVHAMERSRELV